MYESFAVSLAKPEMFKGQQALLHFISNFPPLIEIILPNPDKLADVLDETTIIH